MSKNAESAINALVASISQKHASRAAIDEELAAERALLERVVEGVRPALKSLASTIRKSNRVFRPDSVSAAETYTNHKERGLLVVGERKPDRDHPRANSGQYEGEALYLLDDGRWAEVAYSGSWSIWQGAASGWEGELRVVSIEEVVRDYQITKILKEISDALDRQLGSRAKATKASTERAEDLRAITKLASR